MNIIGRIEEQQEFKRIMASQKSEFVTVFGRRRIGKTFLVREYFNDAFALHVTGLNKVNKSKQIDNFYMQLLKKHTLKKSQKQATDWFGVFEHVVEYLEKQKTKKKVIFLDELPWMATAQSNFLPALENFWNHWASGRKDVVLIVCGSAASWIFKNILRNKGGLHNRVTRRLQLLPFTLAETELFLKKKKFNVSRYEVAKLYMSFGGIPFYLDLLDSEFSLTQNVDRLCFTRNAILRNEFDELYKSLFKNPNNHILIVKIMGQKARGMSRLEILKASKLSNAGSTTRILEELEQSGFITKHNNFNKNSRDAIYQLTDYFTLFHFKFISKVSTLDKNTWLKKIDNPETRTWSGFTFELICMHHVENIKKALGITGIETNTTTWQSKNAQIDLLIDRRDNVITICEMKYSLEPFLINKKYFENLQNKVAALRTDIPMSKSIQVILVTTFGLVKTKYNSLIVNNTVTLEHLFV
jgi:uncharacterized protein